MGKLLESIIKAGVNDMLQKRKKKLAEEKKAREKQELAEKIRTQAKFHAVQWLKIIDDCAELVNTTKNPEVFFPRYSLMLDYLEKLAGLECTGIFDNSKALPSAEYLRVDDLFPAATKDFIDRSFAAEKERAETLKTESGKKKAIARYFTNMDKYRNNMDSENVQYLDELRKAAAGE